MYLLERRLRALVAMFNRELRYRGVLPSGSYRLSYHSTRAAPIDRRPIGNRQVSVKLAQSAIGQFARLVTFKKSENRNRPKWAISAARGAQIDQYPIGNRQV